MPAIITKIKLVNYKRFKNYAIEPKPHINILIGDNESGKSSILQAIDIVASGNIRRIETIGLDRLINITKFVSQHLRMKDIPAIKRNYEAF